MFAVWSEHRSLAPLFVQYNSAILPNAFALLSAATVSAPVVSRVHDIIENLLSLKDEEEV